MGASLPRTVIKEIAVKSGESVYITPVSDAHLDDSLCDFESLMKVMDARRSLPNHRVIWIGDTANMVLPNDTKRFRSSVSPVELRGLDGYLNATTDYIISKIRDLNIVSDFFSSGNHEDEVVKRSGYDITSVLAKEFGAARGGYSGAIDYRLKVTKTATATCTMIWHHGAWGGRSGKGYSGAKSFFDQHAFNWRVALFGHNHSSRLDVDAAVTRKDNGDFVEVKRFIVNCSSFVKAYGDDALETHYAERAGFLRSPRVAPLIRITPLWVPSGVRGNSSLVVDVNVEM